MMYTFDEYEAQYPVTQRNNSNDRNRVTFFQLHSGEEAVVRFVQDTRNDFPILAMHEIMVGNSLRRVGCLATRSNPGACPMCRSTRTSRTPWGGDPVEAKNIVTRVYIKLIQYVPDETGKIVAMPKIWDRPVSFVKTYILPYLDSYGMLSDMVCKIRRDGTRFDTKYTIIPNLPKAMYSDELYPKIEGAFDNFNLLGGIVLTPTAEDMLEYEQTGVLPRKNNSPAERTQTPASAHQPVSQAPMEEEPLPWEQPQATTMQRPTRMY